MMVMLDTNAYTAFRAGDARVRDRIARADAVGFSAIVAGELLYGFRHGARTGENLADLERFLASPWVRFLEVGYITADRFGRISASLRRSGTPIPTNDIWIAAQALEHGADLLSFDRHFEHVPGLAWVDPGR